MTKYVVAVSGGIDSVVLLDMMMQLPQHELIVAHFDHGIRSDSSADALFVEELASRHDLPFETRREELGPTASEDLARTRRYAFLREVARKHGARIVTAHHADDAVETVAINFHRGTGWRGLAVLDSDIVRPLLGLTKSQLAEYARLHELEWREDSTNAGMKYLRNRIRRSLQVLAANDRRQLLQLRHDQVEKRRLINEEIARLVGKGPQYSRYFFSHIPTKVALECLRFVAEGRLTRPQLQKALFAIKTARAGTSTHVGGGVTMHFTTRNFRV